MKQAATPPCLAGPTWNSPACVQAQSTQCVAEGKQWNGVSCEPRCAAGEQWNGTACEPQCAGFESQALLIAAEARSARAEMDAECTRNPSSQACKELTMSHDEIISRYRMVYNEAPIACRATLPDPLTL